MKPVTIVIICCLISLGIWYAAYRIGRSEGEVTTKQEYQNEVSLLQHDMDSLARDRAKLSDSAFAVARRTDTLNQRNDSLTKKLNALTIAHQKLKLQYAKVSRVDSFRRSDIIRYVADSVSAPVP